MKILEVIQDTNQTICDNIEANKILNDRGFLSQNILPQLRNLVEHCSMYMVLRQKGLDDNITLEDAKKTIPSIPDKISTISKEFRFIKKFHDSLQITKSHYTHDKNNSERLMLKYYEYLLLLKKLCRDKFGLNILGNLHKFPLYLDKNLDEYYEKILSKLDNFTDFRLANSNNKSRYYVWKIKPVFIKEEIIYEITLTNATDNVSKFSRIVAFSKTKISDNYAIKAKLEKSKILIKNKNMPIFIISEIETSIRPCEFDNFARIFGKKKSSNTEIERINKYITKNDYNLVDIICFDDNKYNEFKQDIKANNIQIHFLEILDKCRQICLNNAKGTNILKYLLYRMNNKVIKAQILKQKNDREYKPNHILSDLYLQYESIPFDDMPFASSLCGHNPKISDLFECIDYKNREHEFLAKFIVGNIENNGVLYTKENELSNFSNLPILIDKFNNLLYKDGAKQQLRKICKWKDNYCIKSYETDIINILKILKELSKQGLDDYEEFANNWIKDNINKIDDETKVEIIKKLFIKSKVAFVYGAAGTGKSTLANHISNLYNSKKQIFLAQTHPAIENIKSKVQNANSSNTYTIAKIVKSKQKFKCDLLFIDECSTVSNADMVQILNKVDFEQLVLIGDTYQIEAIKYGVWFDIAREFLPKHCQFKLEKPYRTQDDDLLRFWECVRKFKQDDTIDEFGVWGKYFLNLDEKNDEIFHKQHDDEVVLCLNYDGLYGVNNLNKFLQIANKNPSFEIGNFEFKVDDPILFVDNNFFISDLHNNLKGKIINIVDQNEQNKLYFEIEVDKIFEENHSFTAGLKLISKNDTKSIVGFSVDKNINTDNDDEQEKLPFMLAYAVSIHKSQGLEYESVKIVITREMEENITHSIFYTAITRSKKYLKIYWSPETQRHIIKNFNIKNNRIDVSILKAKEQI
ncbi:hypothetical protein CR66_05875 [Campylobacter mucosalis]|uniref:ATP-dependent DNA helicase n=1 Tax=Campylobacter mucosalis TaxID=202 RepID=UPI0004DA56F2|nr:ATP-dependent RecD-like DNA helicase [Campylobacter mucosalis]KEA45679.1 hypothetical protein CR66_05875 [Campylobacter mucosalis]QKF63461.1 RecD-like DNA helicase (AAA domain) [Campylobacter mucosalis]